MIRASIFVVGVGVGMLLYLWILRADEVSVCEQIYGCGTVCVSGRTELLNSFTVTAGYP